MSCSYAQHYAQRKTTHTNRHVVTAVRVRLRTANFSGYAQLRTARSEGGARLHTVEQHFNRAHKWAEMLRHRCILGDPQQKGHNQSTKKTKINKRKIVPWPYRSSQISANCLHCCRGSALPTRVWAISDGPLYRGGIDIWSILVFIHYWGLLKKLSILSIDIWAENPFFHALLVQAKFRSGAFGAHGLALPSQKPAGRGGGRVGVKDPVPAPPPPPRRGFQSKFAVKNWSHSCARLEYKTAHGCARVHLKRMYGCARQSPTLVHGCNHMSAHKALCVWGLQRGCKKLQLKEPYRQRTGVSL